MLQRLQRELLDSLFLLAAIFDRDGSLVEANEQALNAFGLTRGQVIGKPFAALAALVLTRDSATRAMEMLRRAQIGDTARGELDALFKGGSAVVLDCTFRPVRNDQGQIFEIAATGIEITANRRNESALRQLDRFLQLLRGCNRLLGRVQNESELLTSVTDMIVTQGGYRLAWVGYARKDPDRTVAPVAVAGFDAGYVRRARISWSDSKRGAGPTGAAIRTGTVQICREIESDPLFEPWRLDAHARGYSASIALPLTDDEGCFGALNIYAAGSGSFDEAEVALLGELAWDLAYGIGALRAIAERRRAQEQVERLARILRMQSGINSAVLRIQDPDELMQEACRLATEVGGYDRAVFSVVDPGGRVAVPRFRAGSGDDFPEPEVLPLSDGLTPDLNLSSRALRTGEIAVSDLTRTAPAVAMRDELVALGYKAMIALPLIVAGRRVAVLVLTCRDRRLIDDGDLLVLLQDMISSLSFALRSRENAAAAQYLAYFDSLTGLAKRSLFAERLQDTLRRESGPYRELAVAVFDIRGLNRINDTFGRHLGDKVLQEVAARLRVYAHADEHLGHFGGGCFALLEPRLSTGDESIRSVVDASVFVEPFEIEGQVLRLSCSYGVAHHPRDGNDGATLVQRAEAALKQAKESGEHYLHYHLDLHSQIAERLELEHKLSTAIAESQFVLHYQPQINLRTGKVDGVEALLRWQDPARGLVSPQEFLPVLESTGMILAVGRWVLSRAASDCERWHRRGLPPLRVAVNVSAVQLRQPRFVEEVLACRGRLAACGGFGLDLEITETTLLQDLEGASARLRELRNAGVRIALDDFGTGYSSLGLLPRLPVDVLKIDRSFVSGVPGEPTSVVLVETILRLAYAFKLTTIVEGVETEEQLRALRDMHCDSWQGYLHGPAVPASRIELQLRTPPQPT
jgi:diguanylate cyclase (GGDEF)-like protein/PAS domain S-box-containing protein